jgi:hypothetical protein
MKTVKAIGFSALLFTLGLASAYAGELPAPPHGINSALQARIEARMADRLRLDLEAQDTAREKAVAAALRATRKARAS